MSELQPSNDTVRYGPNRTPDVVGWANGPASTSNNARTGALPSPRRCPGANRPAATVTVRMMAVSADGETQ
ncbi:hypothetical protein [Streptomyces milbemycinicus]|uniref:Uncharacterized protein n=1 Tax=Streptomyces milbemycinicus TaxID=476552 RepID=A0ABW8M0T9_9ACTN